MHIRPVTQTKKKEKWILLKGDGMVTECHWMVTKWSLKCTCYSVYWIVTERSLNGAFQFFMEWWHFVLCFIMSPLKKGAHCFATVGWLVCRSVCRWVCKPSVVRSISFDPFTWWIPNLVQGLSSMSRWSLLIFRSHVQKGEANFLNPLCCPLNIFWLALFWAQCDVHCIYFKPLLTCFGQIFILRRR